MKLTHTIETETGKLISVSVMCKSLDDANDGTFDLKGIYFDGKDVTEFMQAMPDELESLICSIDWAELWAETKADIHEHYNEAV